MSHTIRKVAGTGNAWGEGPGVKWEVVFVVSVFTQNVVQTNMTYDAAVALCSKLNGSY